MNRNDLKDPHPVYISKATITEYKKHYEELVVKSWSPGGFNYMGAACEAEYVLTNLFHVPQADITEIMNRAMKESNNERKTNS